MHVDYLLLAANNEVNSKGWNKASTSPSLLSCTIIVLYWPRAAGTEANNKDMHVRINKYKFQSIGSKLLLHFCIY